MNRARGEAWLSSRQKRLEDVLLTTGILPFAGTAGIAGAIGVLTIDKVNPLFAQERVGHTDTPFTMFKLRTMPNHADSVPSGGNHYDERASRLGKILRKLRVDETPQIWNVWNGSMSVIGPRALVEADYTLAQGVLSFAEYTEWRRARTIARPGIFDAYGVKYHKGHIRSDPESLVKARVASDMAYVEQASHDVDLSILLDTFKLFGKMALSDGRLHD